jgi:hypothetical protein
VLNAIASVFHNVVLQNYLQLGFIFCTFHGWNDNAVLTKYMHRTGSLPTWLAWCSLLSDKAKLVSLTSSFPLHITWIPMFKYSGGFLRSAPLRPAAFLSSQHNLNVTILILLYSYFIFLTVKHDSFQVYQIIIYTKNCPSEPIITENKVLSPSHLSHYRCNWKSDVEFIFCIPHFGIHLIHSTTDVIIWNMM